MVETYSSDELTTAICPCTGITVAQVKMALAAGARSTEEIFERNNEIVYCSKCMVDIDDMVFAELRRQREAAAD